MQNQEIQALGHEKISKLLLKFSIPCVMGLLISALYNEGALVRSKPFVRQTAV